ncbi:four helix bundle protein [Thalassotalea psychrophila]|uniref:Four helix bundle protein n=1 Tax=Thalassotalea psychrophila TaxID=3065647 RepID=A0ABY9TQV3_9GAMM|nr:four helix bundle protein [Colwelliaceae bacterium SQ149]
MQYENLKVWQRSCQLSVNVYKALSTSKEFGFKDQITRSALSVPSNIAEGLERKTNKEKYRFLSISKASIGEFKTQAYIGMQAGFIDKNLALDWIQESEELARMLAAFMKTISTRN